MFGIGLGMVVEASVAVLLAVVVTRGSQRLRPQGAHRPAAIGQAKTR